MNDDDFFKKNDESIISLSNAIAFSAKMRKAGVTKVIGYNPNRLREIYLYLYNVGLHPDTIKGYVGTLLTFDLADIKDNILTLKKIRSTNRDRNFEIPFDKEESIRQLANKFAELLVSSSMRAIGYVLQIKKMLEDPKDLRELKILKSRARRLGFDIYKFKDNGVSYSLLSKRFNTSRPTIARLVKSCCSHGIIAKMKHISRCIFTNVRKTIGNVGKFLSSIKDMYTYHYYNALTDTLKIFKVECNTYEYNPYNRKNYAYNIG